MKKKFKLFATVASLCLAIALMGFGVYAASTVTVTVTSNVSFTASAHVRATIEGTETAQNTSFTADNPDNVVLTAASGDKGSMTFGDNALGAPTNGAQNIIYSYTITITNNAAADDTYDELQVTVTKPTMTATLATDGYVVTFTSTQFTGSGATATATIAAEGQASYTVTITIDPNRTLTKTSLGTEIELVAQ